MALRDMCSRSSCKTMRVQTKQKIEAVNAVSDPIYCNAMFEVNVGSPIYYVLFTHCHIW